MFFDFNTEKHNDTVNKTAYTDGCRDLRVVYYCNIIILSSLYFKTTTVNYNYHYGHKPQVDFWAMKQLLQSF